LLAVNKKKNKVFFMLCGGKSLKKSFSTFFLAEAVDPQELREIFFVRKTEKLRNCLSLKGLRRGGGTPSRKGLAIN
jgi:hypothetical protein